MDGNYILLIERTFWHCMKNKEKYFYCFFAIVLMIFYTNPTFVAQCDIRLHYEFAMNIPLLFENGLEWFADNVKYAHVLSYPGWHFFFLLVYKVCKIGTDAGFISIDYLPVLASAIVNTAFSIITIFITSFGLQRCFEIKINSALCISGIMTFVGPIFLPVFTNKYYLGQFTANPWHNPTTIAVEPFSIACFFLLYYLRKKNREVEEKKINIMLGIFAGLLLISAFFKPSFYQSFVPAVIVFLGFDFFFLKQGTKKMNIKCALATVPVCMLAVFQYMISFSSTSNGIVIKPFEVWLIFSKNLLVSFVCSYLFIIVVVALLHKIVCKKEYVIISGLYVASAVSQFILFSFAQKAETGDFLWGVYLASYTIFLSGIILLRDWIKEYGFDLRAKIAAGVLGGHVVCGIGYFVAIYLCGSFNI